MARLLRLPLGIVFLAGLVQQVSAKGKKIQAEDIGKKVTDYNDVDVERLLDQWDANDEEYDQEDEDDPRLQERPKINIADFKGKPEDMLKMSKKGQPLMMFATVAGNPTRDQTEQITGIWQTSLRNAQIQAQRYVIADNRIIFQLEDGSKAWAIKDYLVTLDNCAKVEFENMEFPGKGAGKTKLDL